MIFKPSELHAFLNELGIAPKKGLSQNFLTDGNIIRKIVKAADVQSNDIVFEIGPGPGALTYALLETGAQVFAVEKDEVLAKALMRLNPPDKRLIVFCDDVLNFPLEDTFRRLLPKGQKAKVIANLPYHLTTPILTELVVQHDLFSVLVLMVQDEVAKRFTASPGNKEYGSITLFLNYHAHPSYAFGVSSHCFYPKPKVESAVVKLELHPPPYVENEEAFFHMTRTAFQHRRKMLRAALKSIYQSERVTQALTHIGHNPQARPEDLSLNDWILLYQHLSCI